MHPISYTDAVRVVEDGDVVFIHGSWTNPVQALIMLMTASPFSHVCIAFRVGSELLCVEAQGRTRRRILPLAVYSKSMMTVIPAPKPWSMVRERALARVGDAKYGLFEAIYVGVWEFVMRRFNVELPLKDPSKEYCSAFVADMMDLPVRSLSPQKLYEQLIKKGP